MKNLLNKPLYVIENLFFFALTLLSLAPVVTHRFFTTIDGASHTYNALLLNRFIFNSADRIVQYLEVNSFFISNWTDHLILAFLINFMQPEEAEKVLAIIIILSFAFSFRYLILRLNPKNRFLSYFVFPLLYSAFFFIGLYNFCISLPLLLIAITQILSTKNFVLKNVILFISGLLIYFSSMPTFIITPFLAAIYFVLSNNIRFANSSIPPLKNALRLKKVLPLLLFTVPGLTCLIIYSLSTGGKPALSWLNMESSFEQIFTGKFLIIYSHLEDLNAILFVTIIAFLSGTAIASGYHPSESDNLFLRRFFGASCAFAILLYFIFPDEINVASMISLRILLIFFIFLLLWLSVQRLNPFILFCCALLITISCFFNANRFRENLSRLNTDAYEYYRLGNIIEPYSKVFYFDALNYWYLGHHFNCAAYQNVPLIINNYEFGTKAFPLTLKTDFESDFLKRYNMTAGFPEWKQRLYLKPFDYIIFNSEEYINKLEEDNSLGALDSNYVPAGKEGNKFLFKKRD